MYVDLTVPVTPAMRKEADAHESKVRFGHIGTHFDAMDKVFPLDYLRTEAVVFDVADVRGRDITADDVDMSQVRAKAFAIFRTGFIEQEGYGGKRYFTEHPQLATALIDSLLGKGIAMIGVDFAGIRRAGEHTPIDQYCADRGVFVVENLCNLATILGGARQATCTVNTYPLNFLGVTGLPCRVVAEV